MSKAMSERQRYWFEPMQRADGQQVSLARYAREQGLVARQLYGRARRVSAFRLFVQPAKGEHRRVVGIESIHGCLK